MFILRIFPEIVDFGVSKSAQPILISLGKGRELRPRPFPRLIRMGCADFEPPRSTISGKLIKIINFELSACFLCYEGSYIDRGIYGIIFRDRVLDRILGSLGEKACSNPI